MLNRMLWLITGEIGSGDWFMEIDNYSKMVKYWFQMQHMLYIHMTLIRTTVDWINGWGNTKKIKVHAKFSERFRPPVQDEPNVPTLHIDLSITYLQAPLVRQTTNQLLQNHLIYNVKGTSTTTAKYITFTTREK